MVAAHWAFCLWPSPPFSKDQWFCWDLSHKLSLQSSETSSGAITFTSATLASTSSLKLAWHFLTLEHVHPVPLPLNQFSRLRPFVLSEPHTWAHMHVHTQNLHYLSSRPIRNSTKGTTHTHTPRISGPDPLIFSTVSTTQIPTLMILLIVCHPILI